MRCVVGHLDGWTVVVPVKATSLAKSRLTGFSTADRMMLARAFTLDTVSSAVHAQRVAQVVAITAEPDAPELERLGAIVLQERSDAGLNAALGQAAELAQARWPGTPVAAVTGDLPSARPEDFDEVLAVRRGNRWFVADAEGIGTTLLAAASGIPLDPMFGEGSRAAHLASGAMEVTVPELPRLRRDVDIPADLSVAIELGVGAYTKTALTRTGIGADV